MKNHTTTLWWLTAIITGLFTAQACQLEEDFLAAKPNIALAIPTSLQDYASLLNNENLFTYYADPVLGEISSDDLYLDDASWLALAFTADRNAYVFAEDINAGSTYFDGNWNTPYKQIYYVNTILKGLAELKIDEIQREEYNRIKGTALFLRAINFYSLLQVYAKPYDPITAESDPGVILRLDPNMNLTPRRSSVAQCYDRIFLDLNESLALLPEFPLYKTQPSKWAANALLARIYLTIGNYELAMKFAADCLNQNNTLVDYNLLEPTTSSIDNDLVAEIIFHRTMQNASQYILRTRAIVDTSLYEMYDEGDLRQSHFFNTSGGFTRFRGTYDYQGMNFTGLATDEMYLIKAECEARMGNIGNAMETLNTLVQSRWKEGAEYHFYQAVERRNALELILRERRKELLFRGLRWVDIRRLNKEGEFPISVRRFIGGETFELYPNDPRYVFQIPYAEIELTGISQNTRSESYE